MIRDQILHGHVLDVLRTLPDASVQSCVTSPPYYGLRSYNTTPQIWDGFTDCKHQWGEPIRTPWANEVPGPNGRKKNSEAGHNRTKETGPFCQKCHAIKCELGQEPSMSLYIQHLVRIFREVGRVLRRDGTLWVNLGDSYAGSGRGTQGANSSVNQSKRQGFHPTDRHSDELPNKSLMMIPARFAIAMQDEGWILRSEIVWNKPTAMPESVKDRPTRAHEMIYLFSKQQRYYYDREAIGETLKRPEELKRKNPAVFGGRQKHEGYETRKHSGREYTGDLEYRNARDVWDINTESFPDAHYAVMPTELVRRCILASSRPDDIILDPFSGSGTTAMVSRRLGRGYLGIELNTDYIAMALERIRKDSLPEAMRDIPASLVPPTLWEVTA